MKLWICALALLCAAGAEAQGVSLFISISTPQIDPGLPLQYTVSYTLPAVEGADAFIDVELPPGFVFKSGKNCGLIASNVRCSAFPGSDKFTIDTIAPDIREGANFTTRATLTYLGNPVTSKSSTWATLLARTFVVDRTSDAGPGSLRAAIDAANASCVDEFPCVIAFRLGEPPSAGYHTLAPLAPLPVITADRLGVNGTTQTRSTAGDTNPDGPEIFIDGAKATSGDAFTLGGCGMVVEGVAVGNFPGAGVHVLTSGCQAAVHDNYLGVDPTGLHAAPNERGIMVDQARVDITNNLISANRRSGIFFVYRVPNPDIFDQSSSPKIRGNTIGLDRNHQPLGNGASGIYVDGTAILRDNYITFNHDFGVAVANSDLQSAVDIQVNSIFANFQMGIDIGLDGLPPSQVPTIRSARYDAATNRTLIDAAIFSHGGNLSPKLTIYASDAPHRSGFGDGQYLLGDVFGFPTGQFVQFSAIGDWRGKWVSATQTNLNAFEQFNIPIAKTSEFSRAVKVE